MIDLENLHRRYRRLLLDDVVPFWFRHGIDRTHGGVLTCMNDDGSLVSGDKFIWSQARSVWTFSALYNRVEKRPEFLKAAENSIRFLLAHGRDPNGRWFITPTGKADVIEGPTSIYSDCFAIYGFSEYYRATKDERLLSIALETFERVRRRVEEPDFSETAPYPLPLGWKNHGIPMMLTELTNELAQTTADSRFDALASEYAGRVMNHFVRPDRKVILEFLTTDYEELPPPAGTFVMPGHAIESMWFVMHLAERRGNQRVDPPRR